VFKLDIPVVIRLFKFVVVDTFNEIVFIFVELINEIVNVSKLKKVFVEFDVNPGV
jgi:hypothetical protein